MAFIMNTFLKCPITCCEFVDGQLLIGYGPYLSLINDVTFEEISRSLVLTYRVIHKIVKNDSERLICVFGQKCFNIVRQNENNEFVSIFDNLIELDDWIFDIFWLKINDHGQLAEKFNLLVACAHNQCFTFSFKNMKVVNTSFCEQKCMLYSAKFIDVNNSGDYESILVGSGTIFNQILLWSVAKGHILVALNGHQGVIFSLDYSSKLNLLFSTSDDRSVNVWKLDLEKNENNRVKNAYLLTRFYGHDARVWKCCNFIDEKTKIKYLCSIGEDLNCCLWNVNEKELVYRFNPMRKGSKNIWSLCLNQSTMELITGWGDGGLRKFSLKSYLKREELEIDDFKCKEDLTDWSLKTEIENDFIRSILFLSEKIICSTNLGYLYLIDSNSNSLNSDLQRQRLLLKNDLLAKYNLMVKLKVDENNWVLALGTIKGFLFLINLKNSSQFSDNTSAECIDLLTTERELMSTLNFSGNSSKICSLMWSSFKEDTKHRYFLLVCFSFLDGLTHLYEWDKDSNKLILVSRLNLPQSKHRWFVSFSVILNRVDMKETIYLTGGDKCGNLHFYIIVKNESKNDATLLQPVQSIKNLTKENASISAIYSKCCSRTDSQNSFIYLIICCAKDGFYRIFEFNSESLDDENFTESSSIYEKALEPLKLINKCQINSYIDIIESILFNEISLEKRSTIDETNGFNLENDLKAAICFYGDKFLLWDFQLNRALFEFKCGGSHRSWDYEFCSKDGNDLLFRFIYIKNKTIGEARKILEKNETRILSLKKLHSLSQIFHGNIMTKCKYFKWDNYLLSASEDTQIILNKITVSPTKKLSIDHQFHLQGHDSAVKCFDYCDLNEKEVLLISAGGKANIKIWKVILSKDSNSIEKIIHLYEFKRLIRKKLSPNEKPWLYLDIKSNPEIRFMDVVICENFDTKYNSKSLIVAFACSDGFVRVFRYNLEENKLYLINKYEYPKCLFCIKHLKLVKENVQISYLICFGTDGKLLKWKLNIDENSDAPTEFQKIDNLHQSGINGVDVWEESKYLGKYLIATVGDDTRLSVLQLDLTESEKNWKIIKLDMAHASNIVDCKFLSRSLVSSVAKDQRMILWKIDYQLEKIEPIKVIFVNVPDIASMDVFKLEDGSYRFSIIGMGIEVIELKLD